MLNRESVRHIDRLTDTVTFTMDYVCDITNY